VLPHSAAPDAMTAAAPLRSADVRRLIELARKLCHGFGPALDIEWSFADDAELYLHQVRPITWPGAREVSS
jgi:hypothetical protein